MAARKKSATKKSSAKPASAKTSAKKTGPTHNTKEAVDEAMRELINNGKAHGRAKRGRPSKYTEELGAEICMRICEGESLNSIVRDAHMPNKGTIIRWAMFGSDSYHFPSPQLREKLEVFSNHYSYARMVQAENLMDECTDISDDGTNDFMDRKTKNGETVTAFNSENVHRSKLRVETRKWLGEIFLPKVQAIRNRELALTQKQPLVLQFDDQDKDA